MAISDKQLEEMAALAANASQERWLCDCQGVATASGHRVCSYASSANDRRSIELGFANGDYIAAMSPCVGQELIREVLQWRSSAMKS